MPRGSPYQSFIVVPLLNPSGISTVAAGTGFTCLCLIPQNGTPFNTNYAASGGSRNLKTLLPPRYLGRAEFQFCH